MDGKEKWESQGKDAGNSEKTKSFLTRRRWYWWWWLRQQRRRRQQQ